MARDVMNGPMDLTTKVTLWTACSRARVSYSLSHFVFAGVYYFAESEKMYEGQFAANHFNGPGRLTFKDGRRYEGNFKDGKKHGQGTMVFPNGNKYIGEWANDVQHGMGIFFSQAE